MRQLAIAVVVAAALACVPAAAAKEITSVTACGTDGCTTTKDHTLLAAMLDGAAPTDPPSHPAGAIRLRARVDEPGAGSKSVFHFDNWWVPGTSLVANEDGSWVDLGPRAQAVLQRVAGDHVPFSPGHIGAAFARVGTAPAAPAPAAPAPAPAAATADDGASVDWLLFAIPVGVALVAAAALVLVRRRPGGATG